MHSSLERSILLSGESSSAFVAISSSILMYYILSKATLYNPCCWNGEKSTIKISPIRRSMRKVNRCINYLGSRMCSYPERIDIVNESMVWVTSARTVSTTLTSNRAPSPKWYPLRSPSPGTGNVGTHSSSPLHSYASFAPLDICTQRSR